MKKFILKTIAMAIISMMLLGACGYSDRVMPEDQNLLNDETTIITVNSLYPYYESIDQMASRTTDIIRVEVLDSRVEMVNTWIPSVNEYYAVGNDIREKYDLCTIHRLRVIEVFQGSSKSGDIVEIMQLGGHLDDTIVMCTENVPLEMGDDLIIFAFNHNYENLPMVLVSPIQGVYRVVPASSMYTPLGLDQSQDYKKNEPSGAEVFESVDESNDMVLTIEDLIRISANQGIGITSEINVPEIDENANIPTTPTPEPPIIDDIGEDRDPGDDADDSAQGAQNDSGEADMN